MADTESSGPSAGHTEQIEETVAIGKKLIIIAENDQVKVESNVDIQVSEASQSLLEQRTDLTMDEREQVEQDTTASEDIGNLFEFLVRDVPPDCANFGMFYNKSVFDGWVKQPSACCGASSVAGAYNALAQMHRTHEKAIDYTNILRIFTAMFIDLIAKKQKSFERKFGAEIFDLLSAISQELIKRGKKIGGKKGEGPTKKMVNAILKDMAKERKATMLAFQKQQEQEEGMIKEEDIAGVEEPKVDKGRDASNNDDINNNNNDEEIISDENQENNVAVPATTVSRDGGDGQKPATMDDKQHAAGGGYFAAKDLVELEPQSAIDCLVELFEIDGVDLTPFPTGVEQAGGEGEQVGEGEEAREGVSTDVADAPAAEDTGANEEESDDEEEELEVLHTIMGTNKKAKKSAVINAWDWKKDLYSLIKNIAGIKKLNAERPSTAPIGNWGILQAVSKISSVYTEPCIGTDLDARLLMGKKKAVKSKMEIQCSSKDSPNAVQQQWDTLRSTFSHLDEVLLFHLKNHFALIFAMREWTDRSTGEAKKQILTARKGQRPTEWMDFQEAREVVMGWEGYKIMAISRKNASSTVLQDAVHTEPIEEDDVEKKLVLERMLSL